MRAHFPTINGILRTHPPLTPGFGDHRVRPPPSPLPRNPVRRVVTPSPKSPETLASSPRWHPRVNRPFIEQEAAVEVAVKGDTPCPPRVHQRRCGCRRDTRQQRVGNAVREGAVRGVADFDELTGKHPAPRGALRWRQ